VARALVSDGFAIGVRRIWNGFFFGGGFSVESLGMLRICFGSTLLLFHFTQFTDLLTLDPFGTHFYFFERMWHFQLLGIEYHVPWLSYAVFFLLLLSTLSMTFGVRTRTSIGILIACIFFLKGVRDSFSGDVHHRYLVLVQILLLLLLSKCGHAYSWDERRRASKSRVEEWEASWPIKAMQLYTVLFYCWGGIAKFRVSGWTWVAGGTRVQELLMSRAVMWGVDPGGDPIANPLAWWIAQQPTLCFALGMSTIVMEVGFPLLLLLRSAKQRIIVLLGVTVFHIMNTVLAFVGFGLFPIVFLIFFDLEKVRQWFSARSARVSPA
jgi:hypothetical protein